VRAAVLTSLGEDKVRVRDDVTTVPVGARDVRLAVRATGICRSDLSAMAGPPFLPRSPAVLGHEAAGEVVEVGPAVSGVAVGDHAVVAWIPPCGRCRRCLAAQPYLCTVHTSRLVSEPRFAVGGQPAFAMAGCGTWAEEVVLPCEAVVKIDRDVPFDSAALVSCGVVTGVGAVLNTAQVPAGATVVVIGCGGVGTNVLQGARVAGASVVVGVDVQPAKRQSATRFGADATCDPSELRDLMPMLGVRKGFDYAFEVVGRPETIRAAWEATRRGGTTVVVGAGAAEPVTFTAAELLFDGKRLLSSLYGSADVRRDYQLILDLWRAGRLDLTGLVSTRLPLDRVNDGIRALRDGGDVLRQLVVPGLN